MKSKKTSRAVWLATLAFAAALLVGCNKSAEAADNGAELLKEACAKKGAECTSNQLSACVKMCTRRTCDLCCAWGGHIVCQPLKQ